MIQPQNWVEEISDPMLHAHKVTFKKMSCNYGNRIKFHWLSILLAWFIGIINFCNLRIQYIKDIVEIHCFISNL